MGTVVIAQPVGQLANRLFQLAHFVAFSADSGIPVAGPALRRSARHFPELAADGASRYPSPARPLPPLLRLPLSFTAALGLYGGRLLPGIEVVRSDDEAGGQLASPEFRRLASESRLVLVAGFGFRDYAAFARHRQEVRRVFRPSDAHLQAAAATVERARAGGQVLVGVHRRRGDYADWNAGRYLYTDEQYAATMRRVADLLGTRVSFLICSNEPWEAAAFGGLSVTAGPGHPVQDLEALSRCDFIIGPPSTFSAWASFMGEVPRYQIADPHAEPRRDDFVLHLDG